MSITPEQNAELKWLAEVYAEAVASDCDYDICAHKKELHDYIDSLTQDAQPCAASHVCDCQEAEMPCARAELTDAEIEEELEKVHARFSMYSADVKNIHAARAVIAADRAKRSKQ